MVKKIRKPSQSKLRTSAQTTRNTTPNVAINKRKKKEEPIKEAPTEIDFDDITLE